MKKVNLLSTVTMIVALCGGLAMLPKVAAAQAAAAAQASPFKDRAEYDKYNAILQAKEPAQQVELADAYLTAYPQSKVAESVYLTKLQAYQKLSKVAEVEQTAGKILEGNPKHLYALFILSTIFPQTFNPQDAAADQKLTSAAEHAKAGLEATGALAKPANVSDDDFKKQKDQLDTSFHQTLGFVSLQKKDYGVAAEELQKAVDLDPNNAAGFYQLGIAARQAKPPKDDEAIWAMARAVAITGPTALPPANQAQVKDYLGKVYESVHGDMAGLDDVLKQAAASGKPPSDFHVKTADEVKPPEPEPPPQPVKVKRELTVKPEELSSYDVIQKYLQGGGQKADDTWELLKGSQLTLPGKVIAATPAAKPKTIQMAVAPDLQTQEVRFDVEFTLTAPAAKAIAKGEVKTFEGTVDSYRPKPFLLKLVDAKEAK